MPDGRAADFAGGIAVTNALMAQLRHVAGVGREVAVGQERCCLIAIPAADTATADLTTLLEGDQG